MKMLFSYEIFTFPNECEFCWLRSSTNAQWSVVISLQSECGIIWSAKTFECEISVKIYRKHCQHVNIKYFPWMKWIKQILDDIDEGNGLNIYLASYLIRRINWKISLAVVRLVELHEVEICEAIDVVVPLASEVKRVKSSVLYVGANHLNKIARSRTLIELCAVGDMRKWKSLPMNPNFLRHSNTINFWLLWRILVVLASCWRGETHQKSWQ